LPPPDIEGVVVPQAVIPFSVPAKFLPLFSSQDLPFYPLNIIMKEENVVAFAAGQRYA